MTQNRVEVRYLREHGKAPEVLGDAREVDSLIDALLAGPAYHNMAQIHSLDRQLLPSGYPDHELLIGINRDSPVGVLAFMDAESGNLVSLGLSEIQEDVFYYITGQATEFPKSSEVSIDLIGQAVKEFLTNGGRRPDCIEWQVPAVW